jgi:hypothetical protein
VAEAEKIECGYLGTLLRLTLLAPDLVEAILDGRQSEGLTLPALMEPLPVEWEKQLPPDLVRQWRMPSIDSSRTSKDMKRSNRGDFR